MTDSILGEPPLSVRSEFTADVKWGPLERLERFELVAPCVGNPPPLGPEATGCVHGARASLMLRISGGLLRASVGDLFARTAGAARGYLDGGGAGPFELVSSLVGYLEAEQRDGWLTRAYMTASIVVAVSDAEVWTWVVAPYGMADGRPESMSFRSTDLRYPVLRRLGAMKASSSESPSMNALDQASAVCCIGTPKGYESIRSSLGQGTAVVAFDRGAFPFGPLPAAPVRMRELWAMDAGWRHGIAGRVVVVGDVGEEELGLPGGWALQRIPLLDAALASR